MRPSDVSKNWTRRDKDKDLINNDLQGLTKTNSQCDLVKYN